ncbi:amino acid adenylation domain-containing protein [Burkholderia stagnalis]
MLSGQTKTHYRDFIARFSDAVQRDPDRVALIAGGEQLTCRQLHERVLGCAAALDALRQTSAAALLCLPRGVSLIVAMIACQRQGVPYIPIDFRTPAPRMRQMLDASAATAVVHDTAGAPHPFIADLPAGTPQLDMAACSAAPACPPPPRAGSEAYRIFTSGSTGKPKMVRVTTRGCANLIDCFGELLGCDAGTSVLSSTSPGFDIFYLEYALPLANGAALTLADDEQAASPQLLARLLERVRPALYQTTPSLLKCLWPYVDASFRFDRLLVGGEPLGQALSAQIHARAARPYNMYGPTETTVWSTCQRIDRPGEQRIGRPIQNTHVLVVDEHGSEVPPGVEGRILIGGDAVALGYLGDAALTAEKFIATADGGTIRYDTGDVGFVDREGCLNFVSRVGDFVKINGHRVDLQEIGDTLEALPFISEAAVIHARDQYEIDSLSAFVTLDPRHAVADPVELAHAHLRQHLPKYLWPRVLTVMDAFPRSGSGKLDRNALASLPPPHPAARPVERNAAPDSPEHALIVLLSPYLNVSRLGEHDNFFAHGLTSMHAVSFHLSLADRWPHIELFHIFEYPTLSGLSRIAAETH